MLRFLLTAVMVVLFVPVAIKVDSLECALLSVATAFAFGLALAGVFILASKPWKEPV